MTDRPPDRAPEWTVSIVRSIFFLLHGYPCSRRFKRIPYARNSIYSLCAYFLSQLVRETAGLVQLPAAYLLWVSVGSKTLSGTPCSVNHPTWRSNQ